MSPNRFSQNITELSNINLEDMWFQHNGVASYFENEQFYLMYFFLNADVHWPHVSYDLTFFQGYLKARVCKFNQRLIPEQSGKIIYTVDDM